jgi:predicted secreted protein
MSLTLGLALYFVILWTVLFAVLPFGLRTQHEEGEVVPGTPGSAPARPRIVRVFLINTLVAAVVFAIVWVVIVYKLVTIDIIDVPGVR